jgi:hypothetical protein
MGAKVRVILLASTPVCECVASREQQKCNSSFCWAHRERAKLLSFFGGSNKFAWCALVLVRSLARSRSLAFFIIWKQWFVDQFIANPFWRADRTLK